MAATTSTNNTSTTMVNAKGQEEEERERDEEEQELVPLVAVVDDDSIVDLEQDAYNTTGSTTMASPSSSSSSRSVIKKRSLLLTLAVTTVAVAPLLFSSGRGLHDVSPYLEQRPKSFLSSSSSSSASLADNTPHHHDHDRVGVLNNENNNKNNGNDNDDDNNDGDANANDNGDYFDLGPSSPAAASEVVLVTQKQQQAGQEEQVVVSSSSPAPPPHTGICSCWNTTTISTSSQLITIIDGSSGSGGEKKNNKRESSVLCCERTIHASHKFGWSLVHNTLFGPKSRYQLRLGGGGGVRRGEGDGAIIKSSFPRADTIHSRFYSKFFLPPRGNNGGGIDGGGKGKKSNSLDYRDVFVTRNWYDALVSGYLYHKSGRECWLDHEGKPWKFANPPPGSRRYQATFVYAIRKNQPKQQKQEHPGGRQFTVLPAKKKVQERSFCKYLAEESESDGMRVYIDWVMERHYKYVIQIFQRVQQQRQEDLRRRTLFICYEELVDPRTHRETMYKIFDWFYPSRDYGELPPPPPGNLGVSTY